MNLRDPYLFAPTCSPCPVGPPRKRAGEHLEIVYDLQALPAGQTVHLGLYGVDESGAEYPVFENEAITIGPRRFNVTTDFGAVPDTWLLKETFGDTSGALPIQRSIHISES